MWFGRRGRGKHTPHSEGCCTAVCGRATGSGTPEESRHEAQGPASQRTATGAAEGERAGFAQPRGVGGHPAAHGFEGGERGGDREAVGAAVWFFARPGAGFVERIGEGKRTGTGQGGQRTI